MVSSFYIVLGALLIIKLSLDVIKLRTLYRVAYGDGGFYELQTAIRVQGNAVEYIPVALLLLLVMEQNGAGVDGPCLRGYSDCRPAVSLLRVKTPREPLAAYRDGGHLHRHDPDGAGEYLVSAVAADFSPYM